MKQHKHQSLLTPQEIKKKLIEAGVQPTTQRVAICKYVLCEADHPTAEQVKNWVDKNFLKMSLATVYNTLNTLVSSGLLQEIHVPKSDSVIYDSNLGMHHHFIDELTGKVYDISSEEVKLDVRLSRREFKVNEVSLFLRGVVKA